MSGKPGMKLAILGHHRPVSETPLNRWPANVEPLVVVFESSYH